MVLSKVLSLIMMWWKKFSLPIFVNLYFTGTDIGTEWHKTNCSQTLLTVSTSSPKTLLAQVFVFQVQSLYFYNMFMSQLQGRKPVFSLIFVVYSNVR